MVKVNIEIEVVMVMNKEEAEQLEEYLGKRQVGSTTGPHYYALAAQLDRIRQGAAN